MGVPPVGLPPVAGGGEEGGDGDDFGSLLRPMTGRAGSVGHTAGPAAAQGVMFQGQEFSGGGRASEQHAVGLFLTERGWLVREPQNATELVALGYDANRRGIPELTFQRCLSVRNPTDGKTKAQENQTRTPCRAGPRVSRVGHR